MTTDVSHNGATFTFNETGLRSGTYLDGVAWALYESSVTLNSSSPEMGTYFDEVSYSTYTGAWTDTTPYVSGDIVSETNAVRQFFYRCEANHTAAAATNRPSTSGTAWASGQSYSIGDVRRIVLSGTIGAYDVYRCTANHVSGASTTPGSGASWATAWERLWRFGFVANGVQKNPKWPDANCTSILGEFDRTKMVTYPVTLAAGDCILKHVTRTDMSAQNTSGSLKTGTYSVRGGAGDWACVHIVSEVPHANEISPPPVWDVADGDRPRCIVNVDAWMDRLPAYPSATFTKPADADFLTKYDKFNPAMAIINGMSHYGYEGALPQDFGSGNGNSNWGGYSVGTINYAMIALVTDAMSDANKRKVFIRTVANGWHWYHAWQSYGAQASPTANMGGHHQLCDGPVCLALGVTGYSSSVDTLATYWKSNMIMQAFLVDATYIANMVAHDDANKPFYSRRRKITGIAGNVLTVTYASGTGNETSTYSSGLVGLYLQKEGAATQIDITANSFSTTDTITVSDATGFAVNDIVYAIHPPGWSPVAGEAVWSLGGNYYERYYETPGNLAAYRRSQYWTAQIIALIALGMYNSIYDAAKAYMIRGNADNDPLAGFDYERLYSYSGKSGVGAEGSLYIGASNYYCDKNLWDDHWLAISGVASKTYRRGSGACV